MPQPRKTKCIAFHLPQFHPIPQNDEWWGPGFTEWTNVVQGRPLVRGHYQPHLPADLGFYDLRLAAARAAQAELARTYGIDAFCYYHYWFGGDRLLERPVDELLRAGEPDFPFMLCWANENWTRTWSGGALEVLQEQKYSPEDDLRHIRWLAAAFSDPRYVRIDGRPVMLIYRPGSLPDCRQTADVWRREAVRLGVGEPYLCGVQNFAPDRRDPAEFGLDAAVQFAPDWTTFGARPASSTLRRALRRAFYRNSPYRQHNFRLYDDVVRNSKAVPPAPYKRFPGVSPGFDNSARRRRRGATILLGSTPEKYGDWLRHVVEEFQPYSADENLVFVNAWNEWAEGNHLEPDLRWGRGYLEAHRQAVSTPANLMSSEPKLSA